jgi:hypothetical protein
VQPAPGLRRELRKTVADPDNRKFVYALLDKANDQSWDLAHALDAELDPFRTVEQDMGQLNQGAHCRCFSVSHTRCFAQALPSWWPTSTRCCR